LIREIHARGAVPIVVGGSGFWIQGLLCDEEYPEVVPDQELRDKLEQYTTEELQQELERLDARRSEEVDIHNRRRLIRSIEIATALGEVPPMKHKMRSEWEVQAIYCNYPKEVNDQRIRDNVAARIQAGMIEEAKAVYDSVSAERFEELGLAYKHLQAFWDNAINVEELQEHITREEIQYAKRQRTFLDKMFERIPLARYTITTRDERALAISWALGHYVHD
jgi:tRNA dimethylallyltransferase